MELTLKQTGKVLNSIKSWLMETYGIGIHDASLISYWLFHYGYQDYLELGFTSTFLMISCLIELAKENARQLKYDRLLELAVPFE